MFSGGIAVSDEGDAGDVVLPDTASGTGPGGGGTSLLAAELCEPGKKAGSELRISPFPCLGGSA